MGSQGLSLIHISVANARNTISQRTFGPECGAYIKLDVSEMKEEMCIRDRIKELPKVAALSLTQTILQYLFFYIGLANTSGVKSSVIEGMSVFVCIDVYKRQVCYRKKCR